MEKKEFICINCPMGCRLMVKMKGGEVEEVLGNSCKRGEVYGRQEAIEPKRVLTCLMRTSNRKKPFSVKTFGPIPKKMLFKCAQLIYDTRPEAPISMGDTIIPDICGTGVDVLATQDVR